MNIPGTGIRDSGLGIRTARVALIAAMLVPASLVAQNPAADPTLRPRPTAAERPVPVRPATAANPGEVVAPPIECW